MSRLWSERICVGLGADRVDFVRVGGWRSRVLASHGVACALASAQGLGVPAWHGPLAVLRQGLDAVRDKRKSVACSVVLGNAWVRYHLVPWRDGLANAQEYQSYAAHQMASVYGGLAEKWEVACSEPRYGEPILACAVDKELMAGLRSVIADSGCKLFSVKPYLSSAIARWRRKVPDKNYWFALIDGERICLLNTMAGSPRLLRVQPLRGDVTTELPAMLRRESIALGHAGGTLPVYLLGPGLSRDVLRSLQEMRMRVMDATSYLAPATSDARLAMALA